MSEPQMCVMCNFETDSPDELNDHLDREHKFISELEPSLETQTSVNLNSTNESVKLDVAELVLQTQELITNQKNPSSSKITFRCQICYRSFINPKPLKRHMLSHHQNEINAKDYPVPSGNGNDKNGEDINVVKKKGRPKERQRCVFNCSLCSQTFDQQNDLNIHLTDGHSVLNVEILSNFQEPETDQKSDSETATNRKRKLKNESEDCVLQRVNLVSSKQLNQTHFSNQHNAQDDELTILTDDVVTRPEADDVTQPKKEMKKIGPVEEQKIRKRKSVPIDQNFENNNPVIEFSDSKTCDVKKKIRTIQIFEQFDKVFGVNADDQKLLDEITSRKASIKLHLAYSSVTTKRNVHDARRKSVPNVDEESCQQNLESHQNGNGDFDLKKNQTEAANDSGDRGDNLVADVSQANVQEDKDQNDKSNESKTENCNKANSKKDKITKPDQTYWCTKCDLSFPSTKKLSHHMNKHFHPQNEAFISPDLNRCDVCGEHFARRKELKAHKRSHRKQKSKPPCKIEIKSEVKLEKSEQSLNDVTSHTSVTCVICNAVFDSEDQLNVHEDEVHITKEEELEVDHQQSMEIEQTKDSLKPYSCSVCSKRFKYEDSKKIHEAKYHDLVPEEPNKDGNLIGEQKLDSECKLCGKTYLTDIKLKKHLREYHATLKCKICGTIFSSRSKLNGHIKKDHSQTQSPQGDDSEIAEGTQKEQTLDCLDEPLMSDSTIETSIDEI